MVAGAQQPLLASLQCPWGHRSLILVRAFQTKGFGRPVPMGKEGFQQAVGKFCSHTNCCWLWGLSVARDHVP